MAKSYFGWSQCNNFAYRPDLFFEVAGLGDSRTNARAGHFAAKHYLGCLASWDGQCAIQGFAADSSFCYDYRILCNSCDVVPKTD